MRDALLRLRSANVHLALDDFDQGVARFDLLAAVPFDALKVSHSLAKELGSSPGAARAHGANVVCAGIETPRPAVVASEVGCRFGQGYLFGRPALSFAGLGPTAVSS